MMLIRSRTLFKKRKSKMRQETVSVKELFTEEMNAVTALIEWMVEEQNTVEWNDSRWFEIQEEIVKLQHAAEYLALRVAGYYEVEYGTGEVDELDEEDE